MRDDDLREKRKEKLFGPDYKVSSLEGLTSARPISLLLWALC
ncbi:MAG: hypothetical protein ACYDAP_12410 [Thermoplasmataceae archaeon]